MSQFVSIVLQFYLHHHQLTQCVNCSSKPNIVLIKSNLPIFSCIVFRFYTEKPIVCAHPHNEIMNIITACPHVILECLLAGNNILTIMVAIYTEPAASIYHL